MKMCWFPILLFLFLSFHHLSEANKPPSAVVFGTIYCDTTCSHYETSHFISGATVSVECGDDTENSIHKRAKTDTNGEFKVELDFPMSEHAVDEEEIMKSCSVRVVSSGESKDCAVMASSSLQVMIIKSRTFDLKPLKQAMNNNINLGGQTGFTRKLLGLSLPFPLHNPFQAPAPPRLPLPLLQPPPLISAPPVSAPQSSLSLFIHR